MRLGLASLPIFSTGTLLIRHCSLTVPHELLFVTFMLNAELLTLEALCISLPFTYGVETSWKVRGVFHELMLPPALSYLGNTPTIPVSLLHCARNDAHFILVFTPTLDQIHNRCIRFEIMCYVDWEFPLLLEAPAILGTCSRVHFRFPPPIEPFILSCEPNLSNFQRTML